MSGQNTSFWDKNSDRPTSLSNVYLLSISFIDNRHPFFSCQSVYIQFIRVSTSMSFLFRFLKWGKQHICILLQKKKYVYVFSKIAFSTYSFLYKWQTVKSFSNTMEISTILTTKNHTFLSKEKVLFSPLYIKELNKHVNWRVCFSFCLSIIPPKVFSSNT